MRHVGTVRPERERAMVGGMVKQQAEEWVTLMQGASLPPDWETVKLAFESGYSAGANDGLQLSGISPAMMPANELKATEQELKWESER
jgi:hypothetical protein